MISYAIPKRQLYGRALSLNIDSRVTCQFVKSFDTWCQNSGYEWTVARIKSIKQDLINYIAMGTLPSTPWVGKNRRGHFKGCLGYLFRYSRQSSKCFNRVLTLLNISTSVISDQTLSAQEHKFINAVTQESDPTPDIYLDLIGQIPVSYHCDTKPETPKPFEVSSYTTPSREKRILSEFAMFWRQPEAMRMFSHDYFMDVLWPAFQNLYGYRGYSSEPYIGTIFCTQNPGLKGRFFASPHLWLQHSLKPMGKIIYNFVKDLPWDCTFDQDKPDSIVQQRLSKGETVYCFDLSSATDRFPFDLQLKCLRTLFTDPIMKKHIDWYETIQSFPYNFNGKPLKWARGQALGMYPSFGTFTLTHGMILYAMNGYKYNHEFFVLGDDVMILDQSLARQYQEFLHTCDIPFAPEKTVTSCTMAEFAGKVYTPQDCKHIPKWKSLSKSNILDTISTWGLDTIRYLPKKAQPLATAVAALPYPYGCGLNPLGLTLEERFEDFEDLLVPVEKELEFLTNYRSLVMSRYTHHSDLRFINLLSRGLKTAEKADQALADKVLSKHPHLTMLKEMFPIMGKNLYSIDSELDLPLVGKEPSSQVFDQLDRYKRCLSDLFLSL
jgi:RNA-dependent RNA polymerase